MSRLAVAILAGGLATRLRPATDFMPKSLLHVAGRPFICHQLELLHRQGIKHVVLCVGHLGEQIEAIVGDGKQFGLSVAYSYDGEILLGTGGAVKRALPLLGDPFFVLYGDSYLPCSFAAVQAAFAGSGAPALMTVFCNDNQWDSSNILFENGVIVEYNKRNPRLEMKFIDYGLGVISSDVFTDFPADQPFDLGDLYQTLAEHRQLAGFEVKERFYEIGSQSGIAETERFLTGESYGLRPEVL